MWYNFAWIAQLSYYWFPLWSSGNTGVIGGGIMNIMDIIKFIALLAFKLSISIIFGSLILNVRILIYS